MHGTVTCYTITLCMVQSLVTTSLSAWFSHSLQHTSMHGAVTSYNITLGMVWALATASLTS